MTRQSTQPRLLREATLLRRINRFAARVHVGAEEWYVHVPASARLPQLMEPGVRVLVRPSSVAGRRTTGDLVLVWHRGFWVSVDARVPGELIARALQQGQLAPSAAYRTVLPEVRYGRSRLDFLLQAPSLPPTLVEAKSVTLVEDGVARFPDSPTARGARQVADLSSSLAEGYRAAVVFVIQREDARCLRAHAGIDPLFARSLTDAAARGVHVYAYACRVQPAVVHIDRPVPVLLDHAR